MNYEIVLKSLEALSYVATVGVFIAALVGLKQISVTKKIAKTTSQRDSLKLSSDQIRLYLETIIPKTNELFDEVEKQKIKMFDKSSFELKDDAIEVTYGVDKKQALDEMTKLIPVLLPVLNSLEAFATYFISQLADESLAFKSIGRSYCRTVKKYMPVIATLGGNTHFQNLIELYRIWQARIDKEELTLTKAEIEKKIKTLDGKSIIALGTKD